MCIRDSKKSLGGLDLKQQAASIEGAVTAQQAYVKQLEEEKAAIMALDKYKRSSGSQAFRDLKKLEASLETANQDLAAMMQLEEGVALKLKQTADNASAAAGGIETVGNAAGTTTEKLRDKSNTIGFLINQLEEVPNEKIWQPIKESTDEANNSLGALFNRLEETPVPGVVQELTLMQSLMKAMTDTAMAFGSIIGAAFADMISGAKRGKDAMKEMAKALISAALAASQASIIEAMINSGKFTGPAAPIVIPALVASGVALVQGLFSSLPAFADGGIVSLFLIHI